MTQTSELDLHASIKRLAEQRIKCPQGSLAFEGEPDQQWLCPHSEHEYAGYYTPFVSLRVPCNKLTAQGFAHCDGTGWFYGHPCLNCGGTPTFKDGVPVPKSEWVHGRGWIPEPAVEKAWMRVIVTLGRLYGITLTLYQHGEARIESHKHISKAVGSPSAEGLDALPFRAAEAWAKKEMANSLKEWEAQGDA